MESVTRIKVRYAETDQMGVVHHSVYAVYLEAARVDFLERAGLPYHRVEARGVFFPVVELSSRALLFRYRVEREGVLLAEGFTRHLCQVGERAARIPEDIYRALSVLNLK